MCRNPQSPALFTNILCQIPDVKRGEGDGREGWKKVEGDQGRWTQRGMEGGSQKEGGRLKERVRGRQKGEDWMEVGDSYSAYPNTSPTAPSHVGITPQRE